MGKVDLAFDHITSTKEINELSVILYADSFFYGLWDHASCLLKTGYHPIYNLSSLTTLWDFHYDLSITKMLSAQLPFAHIPTDFFEQEHFDLFFNGLYNLDRVIAKQAASEQLDEAEVTTLHYLDKQAVGLLSELGGEVKAAHISSAMANYMDKDDKDIICHYANNILHISVRDEKGFQFYNQFFCNYASDCLYYLTLVFQQFGFDPNENVLKLGGTPSYDKEHLELVTKHFHLVELVPQLAGPTDTSISSNDYSDLYLCRQCV